MVNSAGDFLLQLRNKIGEVYWYYVGSVCWFRSVLMLELCVLCVVHLVI
jgi:hypothetical protein